VPRVAGIVDRNIDEIGRREPDEPGLETADAEKVAVSFIVPAGDHRRHSSGPPNFGGHHVALPSTLVPAPALAGAGRGVGTAVFAERGHIFFSI
jgi:hypothetical protein